MFDVSWSELLILALVALVVVGPKELPKFLNTLGRYMGVVKRHANEFRSVFDQAMREAEMDQIQKEVRAVGDGITSSLNEATRSVETAKDAARVDTTASASSPAKVTAPSTDAAALSLPPSDNVGAADDTLTEGEPPSEAKSEPARPV